MDAEQTITVLDWADLQTLVVPLARAVVEDGPPEVIVGILRGGMVPAVLLAHLLGVRDVRALALTHTTADGVGATKTVRPVLANPMSLGDMAARDVLVVDDVTGTGDTIATARDLVIAYEADRVRTATCVLNTANWPAWRDTARDLPQTPTYVGRRSEGWVIFPWESR